MYFEKVWKLKKIKNFQLLLFIPSLYASQLKHLVIGYAFMTNKGARKRGAVLFCTPTKKKVQDKGARNKSLCHVK